MKKKIPRRDSNPRPPAFHPDVAIHYAGSAAEIVPFLFTSYNNFRFNSRSMEVSTDFNYFELKNYKNLDLFYSL